MSPTSPELTSVAVELPDHRYEQAELLSALERSWSEAHYNADRLRRLHAAMQVQARHLALPLSAYENLSGFGDANDAFIRVGTELGARACEQALARAELAAADVDAIFFTTVTGLATPTIDARLMNVLDLPADVRRSPMFGLGCVGGAAGVARMADYLVGHPEDVAVLLSVELCSLTLQDADLSIPNLLATGLFGDGAAAVVGVGAERRRRARRGPRVVGSRSAFFPDTERVMGWDIGDSGFKIVLSADVPDIVREKLGTEVDALLAKHGLERGDIDHWVCHPGGPKVISAMESALGLEPDALSITRRSLAEVGNLSSASVLHVLGETLERAQEGDLGLLMAMGPGFCAELVLLSW